MGGNEWPRQSLQKIVTSPTLPLFPPLCPGHVGVLGPVPVSPGIRGRPRNKGEGLVCLEPGMRYRIHDHSQNERSGWLVLRVCFYLLLSAHETF